MFRFLTLRSNKLLITSNLCSFKHYNFSFSPCFHLTTPRPLIDWSHPHSHPRPGVARGCLVDNEEQGTPAVCTRPGGLRVDVGGVGDKEVKDKGGSRRLRWARAV